MTSSKSYIFEVEPAKEATDERPSVGPVYRSVFAKDGFPAPVEGMESCWDVFRLSVEKYPNNPMLGHREITDGKAGKYVWQTYKEVYDTVMKVGNAIRSCGVEPGGRCGIYGANSAEWIISMEACNAHGMYCVPLYDTLGAGAVEFIICHAEVKIVFVEEKKIPELMKALPNTTENLQTLVSFGKISPDQREDMEKLGLTVYAWDEFLKLSEGKNFDLPTTKKSDICTIMYTSGTTGDPKDSSRGSGSKSRHVAIAIGASSGSFLIIIVLGFFAWKYRHSKQVFFDVNDQYDPEVCLGHLKRYSFKELRTATDHFNPKNILGKGGFGVVYKGILNDGTIVAVKRLNDYNAVGGEIQFQTEVELISLAIHRNLLRLYGFCSTECERLLVYPYMPNGSVASRLKDCIGGQPALGWSRRKMIALGTARGLLYLHEQCDPKIIHRDVKAANILLDEDFEAVVGDFGLAKQLDRRESHVTTAVRGTVGHIAPEYLSTGQSSEKTDVFGFGILVLELITGSKAFDISKGANQKGATLDWVKKLHEEGKLSQIVDKDLRHNYDHIELEEIVQVALLCTQFNPCRRPKMSEVLKMLEGDGLAEKWEASQKMYTPRLRSLEKTPQRYSDYIDESSLVVEAMELSGPR